MGLCYMIITYTSTAARGGAGMCQFSGTFTRLILYNQVNRGKREGVVDVNVPDTNFVPLKQHMCLCTMIIGV